MANRKEPLEELLKDLSSNDIKRRLRAVDGLVARGGKQAERELVKLLGDSSWHLRSYVAKVLGGFGKYMISSILSEAKQGIWYVRATACTTLGYIGEIECLDPLLSYLEDGSVRVRIAAEEALLTIISRDRVKFVETYLSRKDADFQEFILEKLKKIDSDLYKDIVDESA